jgi:hypothetical protein
VVSHGRINAIGNLFQVKEVRAHGLNIGRAMTAKIKAMWLFVHGM